MRRPSPAADVRLGVRYMDSLRAQIAGDLDAADEFATRAQTIAVRIGEPDAMLVFYAQDLAIRYQRGTMTEWITPLEESTDPNPDMRAYVSSCSGAGVHPGRSHRRQQATTRSVRVHRLAGNRSRVARFAWCASPK